MSDPHRQALDEFGALPQGVSNLRSRFEQLSQSDKPAPSYATGPRPPSKRNPSSAARSIAAQTLPDSREKHDGASSEWPPNQSPDLSLAPPVPGPPRVGSSRSVSPLPAPSNDSKTCSSSNSTTTIPTGSSTAAGGHHQQPPSQPRPSAAKKHSEGRLMANPSAFGKAAPSLIPQKQEKEKHQGAGHGLTISSEPLINGAPTKAPPPRPPKPAEKFKILDDADLEHLRSQVRVSSLSHRFAHGAHGSADRFSEAVAHAFSSPHARQRSHPAEALSRSSGGSSRPDGVPPPAIPPKPMKGGSFSENVRAMPGTVVALAIDAESHSPQARGKLPVPPPLPSRKSDNRTPLTVERRRRFSLSASHSTGSLPLLQHGLMGGDAVPPLPPLPPLPARRGPAASAAAETSASAPPPVLPPPQRNLASSSSASLSAPVSRSVSGAQSIPISTPNLPARRPQHAHSLSPSDSLDAIQPPPPPLSAPRSLGTSLAQGHLPFKSTSVAPSRHLSSDSSSEDEYEQLASALTSPSAVAGPLSAGRTSGPFRTSSAAELPDSSRANRRAPKFSPHCSTSAKAAFQCFAACGYTVVTGSGDKVKVYRVGESATGLGEKLCTVGEHGNSKEIKLTALEFRPPNHSIPPVPAFGVRSHGETADEGRYLWCGTKDGHIWELDVAEAQTVYSRTNVHSAPIQLLRRIGNKMISMDESGKISTWLPSDDPDPAIRGLRLSNQPITQRIALEKGSFAVVLGQQLWVSAGPVSQRSSKDYSGSKGPRIRVYNPFADDKPFNATSKAIMMPPDLANGVGAVTGGAIIPSKPDRAYLSHDSGHVSIWSRQTFECLEVQKLGPNGITAMAGVVKCLWAANRTGNISVFDVDAVPWRAIKIWPAHSQPVTSLRVDEHGIQKVGRLQVASAGLDSTVHLWDGTLSFDWLRSEHSKREAEFCTYRNLKILQVTFNIDAASPIDLDSTAENMEVFPNMLRNACHVGGDVNAGGVSPDRPPDIIVFGFQEMIDLESKKLTAKSLLLGGGKKKANDLGDRVSRQYRAWHDKLNLLVRLAMPPSCGYLMVQSEHLVGLFTCVFVKQTEFKRVKETAIATVKTGMGGRYGNKGSVIARMVIDHTSLCFANCHLAAGQQHVKQRNADVADILESPAVFEDNYADPAAYVGGGDGSMILDHELCFWGGDLNYRIDLKRETVIGAVQSKRLGALVEADQLRKELKNNPTFRLKPFSEAPLNFPPTYKYDRGTNLWDSSEKSRIPAWCDRILWRSHHPDRIRCLEYRRWETTISDHRPVTAIFEAKVKAIQHEGSSLVEEELKGRWKTLQSSILKTAEGYYDDPR